MTVWLKSVHFGWNLTDLIKSSPFYHTNGRAAFVMQRRLVECGQFYNPNQR